MIYVYNSFCILVNFLLLMQISVDVIFEATSHYRAYDYQGLAKYSDFLFIMAYDESVHKVGPNSGYHAAKWGEPTF